MRRPRVELLEEPKGNILALPACYSFYPVHSRSRGRGSAEEGRGDENTQMKRG
jgi:hypothetical protein